ncbi:acetylcholine-gated cation-selective channel [Branchiostoma belcheri]|nr:acetylcholine-gated cation-selective channel [Branchiostoma belcheri]
MTPTAATSGRPAARSAITSEGANVTYAYRLMQNLLQNYSVAVRPSMNLSNPIQVKFGIALSQIIDMDERNQILTAYVWLRMRWNDCSLKWNPAEYDGLAELRIPSTHVWKPDIVLYNKKDQQTFDLDSKLRAFHLCLIAVPAEWLIKEERQWLKASGAIPPRQNWNILNIAYSY